MLHYDQKLGKRWSASLHGDFVRADGLYPYTLINGELETREKRRNSDIHSYHLEGNLFGDFGKGGEFSFKAYYFDSERGLPGSINLYNKNIRSDYGIIISSCNRGIRMFLMRNLRYGPWLSIIMLLLVI